MNDEEFQKWLKAAEGSELLKYKTDDRQREEMIDDELASRVGVNAIAMSNTLFSFLHDITSGEED